MRKSESAYGIEVSCDAKTPEGPNPLGFLRHSTDWKVFPTIGSLLSIQTYRYRVRCYNWLVHQIFFQLMDFWFGNVGKFPAEPVYAAF